MKKIVFWSILIFLILAGCAALKEKKMAEKYGSAQTIDRTVQTLAQGKVSFYKDVQPILEKRCDVCHSCYDAPCQMKLTSFEGIDRGGSRKQVYNAERLKREIPTRLFIDAHSADGWRKMDFHPILNERNQTPAFNIENSVLYMMLRLKKEHPQPTTELLPASFDIGIDREQTCATAEDFDKYKKKYPLWGMPYALPGLTDKEHEIIVEWLKQGALITRGPEISEKARRIIRRWETFFNGSSLKEMLVSRYIYEHLFMAHIHFDTLPDREFYRLVRSKTPPGEKVVEINTARPYDDPGVDQFWYRLQRVESVIAAKDHTVYPLNDEKMDRYQKLFLNSDYEVNKLPSYETKIASNPLKTFVDLPAKARYKFLLDDARFIVMGFIKGPVCRGQIALNVINDHFFVAFFDPEKDKIGTDAGFLSSVADLLDLPAERESNIRIIAAWMDYSSKQKKYLEAKEQYLEAMHLDDLGNGMDLIWDGDGDNDNALLTIFRHFDSASVEKGFVGDFPETGWVIDYPLLERIHYLLVAGFNVFGNAGHQLETRVYMDYLRMEGENNFLSFLPREKRKTIRAGWYEGAKAEYKGHLEKIFLGLERQTRIPFVTNDPKQEFFQMLHQHVKPYAKRIDYLNRCPDEDCVDMSTGPVEQRADRFLSKMSTINGPEIQVVPDVTFIHVVAPDRDNDLAYTVIRNKALSNNSFLFGEDKRRIVEDDTLTIVKGHVGSYPNSFCRVHIDQIHNFVEDFIKIKDKLTYYNFARKYAVRRTSPDFWEEADWHYQDYLKEHPLDAGQFDMFRFNRIARKSDYKFEW